MSDSNDRKWVTKFKDGRINVHEEERSGRPSVITEDLMQAVETKILENGRFTITTLSLEFPAIYRSVVWKIVTEDLNFKKLCSLWVPRLRTAEHREKRKIMATAFWDRLGVLLEDFMPQKEQRSTQVLPAHLYGSSKENCKTIDSACCQKRFYLFLYLKYNLGAKRLSDNDEVKAAVNSKLSDQAADFFEEGFKNYEGHMRPQDRVFPTSDIYEGCFLNGSRGERGISGSGVYIPTPSGALELKIKNPNYCSVFRSELIANRRGLQCAAQLEDRFQEIWILIDSRASIQHLANWGDIADQTSLDILSLLYDLSSGHSIHFQWIPSHVGIEGNERADFLARTAAVEGVSPRGNLTFSEISTISKLELNRQNKTPHSHAWYFAKCPGVSFRLSSRPLQSTYSRFLSGHTRALRFSNGQKTFPECHWCSSREASPNHILLCLGFKKDEVLCNPLLFLDFLQILGFTGIV
ncbi:RNase H domain-containing protein [Trichonephila clavipes]|nr:RNase H domain-containing protein [Trichonephila clavipes]